MQTYYRCYFVDRAQKIKDVAEFFAADDESAIARAQAAFATTNTFTGFELWESTRCVFSFQKPETES